MIRTSKFVVLLSMWLTTLAVQSARAELVDVVRQLNSLQDDMVRGAVVRGAISKQVEQIEQTVDAMDPESWKEQKNARSAAIFLLCGGAAVSLRRIADGQFFDERDRPLILGSLAFAEGRNQEALKLLSAIDARAQAVTLGGHLALVQGGLLIGTNNARALELFDLARLLMPSSLVEEAALRREISILDPTRAPEKFLLLARRYVSQYSKSPFARNFWDEVGTTTLRLALNLDESRLAEFQALFKKVAAPTQFDLFMGIARAAILNGRVALASAQTKRAEPLAETQTARNRLKFYIAVINALSGNLDDAARDLQQVDTRSLSRGDLEMRDIVTAAIKRLQYVPERDASPGPASTAANRDQQALSPIERSALQALTQTDELLQRAPKP